MIDRATGDQRYPCADCGALRTKAEGGTVFTVCNGCWDKRHPPRASRQRCIRCGAKVDDAVVCEDCWDKRHYTIGEKPKLPPDARTVLCRRSLCRD